MKKYYYNLGKSKQNFKRMYNAQDSLFIHRGVYYMNQLEWIQYLLQNQTSQNVETFIGTVAPIDTLLSNLEGGRYRHFFTALSMDNKKYILNDTKSPDGTTLISKAAYDPHVSHEVFSFLIENGAIIDDNTCEAAFKSGDEKKIEILNRHGKCSWLSYLKLSLKTHPRDLLLNLQNDVYRNMFTKLSPEIKAFILNNVKLQDGATPLSEALLSRRFDREFINFLLHNGAEITKNARDSSMNQSDQSKKNAILKYIKIC